MAPREDNGPSREKIAEEPRFDDQRWNLLRLDQLLADSPFIARFGTATRARATKAGPKASVLALYGASP